MVASEKRSALDAASTAPSRQPGTVAIKPEIYITRIHSHTQEKMNLKLHTTCTYVTKIATMKLFVNFSADV